MQVSVLASGSTGNASFVQIGSTRLLVDAGISARRIKAALADIGVALETLDGILITHEHRDHINGLTTLTKRYHVPIYTRRDTFAAMYCRKELEDECCRCVGDDFGVGGLRVRAFNISHDAADPVGFSIYGQNIKCTVATDLGFVTSNVQQAIDHSDVLILEANHDVDMLRGGSYPRYLKQRILGSRGHLSNDDAAWALVRMKKNARTRVVLAHMSEENNTPAAARDTVTAIVRGQGCEEETDFDFHLAKPDEAVELII